MLTERRIRDTKPGPKTAIHWDGQVKGLGMRITPNGVKAYILNYRTLDGKERRATLARVGEISLKAARERAGAELAAIRAGESDPLKRRQHAEAAPTINDGFERFLNEYAKARIDMGRMSKRTHHEYRNQNRRYISPFIGSLKAADVTRHDIERMVQNLPNTTRNRVLALSSRVFNLFETWEWRPQHTNPCRGIDRAREQARDRVLSESELAALAKALAAETKKHPGPVAAIRMAALTGLRISEVLGIRWEHVDFETGRVTLPETKTGRRTHDLPEAGLAIMESLPRVNGSDWVCTTGRGAMTYSHVRKVFKLIAKAAGLSDVRLHDLRRTVMTRAAMAGVGTHVLRDLLGHKTTAMADRYIRSLGNPVREAREQVGAEMAAIMDVEPTEVVNFHG